MRSSLCPWHTLQPAMNIIAQPGKGHLPSKLTIWISHTGSSNYARLRQLDYVFNGKISLPIVTEIKIICMRQSFRGYFQPGQVSVSQSWMRDQFTFNLKFKDDNGGKKEDLVEMKGSG